MNLRQQMYAIVDRLTAEIDRRFSANKTELAACDAVYPNSQNFLNFDVMAPLAQQFSYLPINTESLKAQVCVAKEIFKKSETVVKTPEDVLQLLHPMTSAFPDLCRFIQLVLTFPVSSAEAERSFSCLKRVKTYLRSTMSQKRLNNLCLLSIEREMTDSVLCNLSPIVDKFAQQKSRRLNLVL